MYSRPRALALLSCVLLASCQPPAAPQPAEGQPLLTPAQRAKQKEQVLFVRQAQAALTRAGYAHNVDGLQGSLDLVITVDRNNRVIGCGTQRSRGSITAVYAYNRTLAQRMEGLCWISVLPAVPLEDFDDEVEQKIIAPLIFDGFSGLSDSQEKARQLKLLRSAQRNFLWERTFASEPLDSIGIATFSLSTDAQGTVQACEVVIDPHPVRRREFKQDNALVERLAQRCEQLDLKQMPGFSVDPKGQARVVVNLEYMPWRNGPVTAPKTQ